MSLSPAAALAASLSVPMAQLLVCGSIKPLQREIQAALEYSGLHNMWLLIPLYLTVVHHHLPSLAVSACALASKWAYQTLLQKGSRPYRPDGGVGDEYDKWTNDGLVESFWGEHIHLGAYTTEEAKGWFHRDDGFIESLVKCTCWNNKRCPDACVILVVAASFRTTMFKEQKLTFVGELLQWGGFDAAVKELAKTEPLRILDVGCGIGGSSRIMAKRYGKAVQVTGITLSDAQVERATQITKEARLENVTFRRGSPKMDALQMEFPEESFDLVWSCECGEHVPDKEKYVEEMCRVLKPGGRLIIATWCETNERKSLTKHQRWLLRFLYEEWSHPMFISIEEYGDILRKRRLSMQQVKSGDWTPQTLPSWRHSIFVGVWWPWPVVFRGPRVWWSTIREIVTIERMHEAFRDGVMQYGVFQAKKLNR
ncbi:hypothetical protein FOZ61_005233 [Perkinsus olseni]|uniref:Methyltransferase domain-containing protein n=1 Tax=Perkinsus olseni TaxID=32597 RepID=A0A7J6L000_PEROL|nr:hypothetical protein FOL46_009942 [Perkinsus olseni]KAF4658825.1 hypothetical protein FOZ61_005233 [Perkinsus olseni]